MRKKIYRISEDQFDREKPVITVSTEKIVDTCRQGENYKGSFTVETDSKEPIRGLIFSDNPYVVIKNSSFSGVSNEIIFEVENHSFRDGDKIEGCLMVLYDGGKASVEYEITYTKKYIPSSIGDITGLGDFVKLTQTHMTEALTIFHTPDFAMLMEAESKEIRLLYKGYQRAIPSKSNLEEFLVAAKQKDALTFNIDRDEYEFYGVSENIKDYIEITRNTWGYIDIKVDCDADFIAIEKHKVDTDIFLGSICTISFYIVKEKLHAGLNIGSISFDDGHNRRQIVIKASKNFKDDIGVSKEHVYNVKKLQLWHLYEDYRLGMISTGAWCDNSVKLLDELIEEYPLDNIYKLIKALCFIMNRQKQEALWLISELKKDIEDTTSADWAFLLYLCTLIEKENSYVDRLTKEIEVIFRNYPEDPMIFWFLTFLRKDYVTNPGEKYRALGQWIKGGFNSPLLYIEVFDMFKENPYLMSNLDEVCLKVLNWAKKKDAITKDIAVQLEEPLFKLDSFDPKVFELLAFCYHKYPDAKMLLAMIKYLLKFEVYEEKYLAWYELAISYDLNVVGLYEAFVMSSENNMLLEFPPMVLGYFRYNNKLPYDKKALLYANIIVHKSESDKIYEQYFRNIESFAIEQMKLGHIDDNLGIIYQDILENGLMDEDIARKLSELMYYKKVACIYPWADRVLVYFDQFVQPFMAPIKEQYVYLPFPGQSYQVFLESKDGNLYAQRNYYDVQSLMVLGEKAENLKNFEIKATNYIVDEIDKRENPTDFVGNDIALVEAFLKNDAISEIYKAKKYPVIIDFLKTHTREDAINEFILNKKDFSLLDDKSLVFCIEAFIFSKNTSRAYDLLKKYKTLSVSPQALLRFCNKFIKENNYTADDFVLSICAYILKNDIFSEDTVRYMAKYFVGPIDEMVHVYRLLPKDCDALMDLEERILSEMLYAEEVSEHADDIFADYMTKKINPLIAEGYITYMARRFILTDKAMGDTVINVLIDSSIRGEDLNDSCRIALLKYLCLKVELTENELNTLDKLVSFELLRDTYFGFYRNMDERILDKYHLYDRYYMEYDSEENEDLVIVYSINNGEAIRETLFEAYPGKYVKQIVLFYSDVVSFDIYNSKDMTKAIHSGQLTALDMFGEGKQHRYDMINSMERAVMYDNFEELFALMKNYQGLDKVTEVLFKIK